MIELAPHHKRGLVLSNFLLNASGVLGFAEEYKHLLDFSALGGFVTNAVTLHPRTPAHAPNVLPLPNGFLLHTGLPNPGVRAILRRYASAWRRLAIPVIAHLAATSPSETRRAVEFLERADSVSGIELGFRDDAPTSDIVANLHAARGAQPILARLPLDRAVELAAPAITAGADALVIAAPPRITVEHNGEPVSGRLYSADNFAPALAAIQEIVALHLNVPLIGAGGIHSPENVQAMLTAGAIAVELDAVLWHNPTGVRAFAE